MKRHYTGGFTMVELMIALALSMIIMAVVSYGFMVTSRATSRGLETNRLHEQAAAIHEQLRSDLHNRVPGTQFLVDSGMLEFTIALPRRDLKYMQPAHNREPATAKVIYTFEMDVDPSNDYPDYARYTTFRLVRKLDDDSVDLLRYPQNSWLPKDEENLFLLCGCDAQQDEVAKVPVRKNLGYDPVPYDMLLRGICSSVPSVELLKAGMVDDGSGVDINWGATLKDWIVLPDGALTPRFYCSAGGSSGGEMYTMPSFGSAAADANRPAYLRVRVPFAIAAAGRQLSDEVGGKRVDLEWNSRITLDSGGIFYWYFKL